jgi:hypothetical protein
MIMGNNSDNYYSKDIKSLSIATATVDIVDAETEISGQYQKEA